MLSDIQIAQQAALKPITKIAQELGIEEEELEPYGRYKAKVNDKLFQRVKDRKDGRLVLVTAINPTPAGEGKTTVTTGLGQAMAKIGKKAVIALREPSLAREAPREAVILRCSRWRISIFTLPAICTPLPPRTIFCALCWTITSTREIP